MNIVAKEISQLILCLRIVYGAAFIGSGFDKYFFCITDWRKQGMSCQGLYIRGACEIMIGCALFTKYLEAAAYAAAAWLLVSGFMVIMHPDHRDTAFRYIVIALGAYTLGRLVFIQTL